MTKKGIISRIKAIAEVDINQLEMETMIDEVFFLAFAYGDKIPPWHPLSRKESDPVIGFRLGTPVISWLS